MLADHSQESPPGADGSPASPPSGREPLANPFSTSHENPASPQGIGGKTKAKPGLCVCGSPRAACSQNCAPKDEEAFEAAADARAEQPANPAAPDNQSGATAGEAPSPSRLCQIDLEDIDIGYNEGAERERSVLLMMGSVKDFGIINPVTVYRIARGEPQANPKTYRIVAGRIRGEAARRMGLSTVNCIVVEAGDLERELIAIDENFVRTSLSPAEEANALGRRKEIHEALNGRAKSKGAHAANAKMGNSFDATAKMAAAFTTVAARVLDRSERQVQRIVERASLGAEALARIAGTSLDSGTEIDLLLKLSPEKRAQLIDRAAAGEIISAVSNAAPATPSSDPAARPPVTLGDNPSTEPGENVGTAADVIDTNSRELSTDCDIQPDHDGTRALMDAWRAASEPERMAFLAWVTAAASSTAATA